MNFSQQFNDILKKSKESLNQLIETHGEEIPDYDILGLNVYSYDLLLNGVQIIHITEEHVYDENGNIGSLEAVIEKYPKEFFAVIDFYTLKN